VATITDSQPNRESDSQDTYLENRDPTEMALCLILASAYLGLAKYCWTPLWTAHNLKLFLNVEGFFCTIAVIAILVGLRPYLSPSSLQISHLGIKYRGPYWPQRRSISWEQVIKVYVSSELIFILYKPNLLQKRMWVMLVAAIYLSERQKIAKSMESYCPQPIEIVTNPAVFSRLIMGFLFFALVIWILEMLMT
jgi:hypothetical protein